MGNALVPPGQLLHMELSSISNANSKPLRPAWEWSHGNIAHVHSRGTTSHWQVVSLPFAGDAAFGGGETRVFLRGRGSGVGPAVTLTASS